MSGLEIALLVFGTACVIISFFIVDNNERVEAKKSGSTKVIPDEKAFNEISKKVIADTNNNAERVLSEAEEKLEALSNDKIMAVGEYSDQIIEKIDTNHKEVVFLYQMLKDKEEELKKTASELETLRIECEKVIHDNKTTAENVHLENINLAAVENTVAETATVNVEAEQSVTEAVVDNSQKNKNAKHSKAKSSAKKSVLSNASSERQYGWGEALAIAEEEQKNDTISERNQEIIELYKQKKSVLEISKLLGMGQGEVKLVIDLYCK